MYFVYLIQNTETKETYLGYTSDIKRRLKEHNSSFQKNSFSHRKNGSWELVYAELFRSKKDAMDRERKLKRNRRGKQELFRRLNQSFYN